MSATGPARPSSPVWDRRLAQAFAFARRRVTLEGVVDDSGYDPELTRTILAAPLRPVFERWFRVDVRGLEHVPDAGAAVVVANHAGTVAIDAVMLQLALLDHHPAHRSLRLLAGDVVFAMPMLGLLARRSGATRATPAHADALLRDGELVGVFPEGYAGTGKLFRDRYVLQHFGHGGFVAAAARAQAPIVPVAIVGAEESYPMLANVPRLARALGLPYFPLTPTFPWLGPLGLVPLPSRWIIEFLPPVAAPDDVADLADPLEDGTAAAATADRAGEAVRSSIQAAVDRLVAQRGHAFGTAGS